MKTHAKPVHMQRVESSAIKAVGYDATTQKLRVQFASGQTYEYHDVPPETHEGLMGADSIGSHFAANIRNEHKATKV